MRAVVRDAYGEPDVLRVDEIPRPRLADDGVLMKVVAVALNAADVEVLRAQPSYVRFLGFGLRKPKVRILGSDVAGRIEAVGPGVTRFRPGDEVFGDIFSHGLGGLAEYVSVPETAPLVPKPQGLTFEEAASLPQAGTLALQGLRDAGRVRPGEAVLIIGAGGGAGTFAVQLARTFEAEVTGVDRSEKLDLVRSLGAAQVVDSTRMDVTRADRRYDVVLDMVGSHSLLDLRRVLKPGGRYALVGASTARLLQALVLGPLLSSTGHRRMGILALKANDPDLLHLGELVVEGQITPSIDRRYPLDQAAEALRYLGEGRARGKLVVTM